MRCALTKKKKGECPRVFFLAPADTSSWSRLEKIKQAGVPTKNVHLFFLCRMFFEELKRHRHHPRSGATSQGTLRGNEHECSECIGIKQPRVYHEILRNRHCLSGFPIPICVAVERRRRKIAGSRSRCRYYYITSRSFGE